MDIAGSGTRELGELGKKKAKIGDLEDGPSRMPSLSPFCGEKRRMADGGNGDGTVESGGVEELEVALAAAEEGPQDPLEVFGSGVMMVILSKLDARSVALSRLVSRGWLAVASMDKIWAPK